MSALIGRPSVQREVDDELAFHIEMTVRELAAEGMTVQDARREAIRRFGDVDAVNAACRQLGMARETRARRAEFLTEFGADLRFAFRQLARAKGFAALVTCLLALGIGATTAVFGALYTVVLRPLPFDHPERVVTVVGESGGERRALTGAEYVAQERDVRSYAHVAAAVLEMGITINDGDVPELVAGGRVTSSYFDVFGVRAARGRVFTRADDTPGHTVVVLSDRAWRTRYNADPSIVGRVTRIDGQAHTIIGVMPASFDITNDGEELWLPLALTAEQRADHASRYLQTFARLQPSVRLDEAASQATAIERATLATFPGRTAATSATTIRLTRYLDELTGDYRQLLLIVFGGVGFVLLIACANVSNLYLARGASRARELAIRSALGAGRGRIVRQLLAESVALAALGAVVGLALAYALTVIIRRVSPEGVPRLDALALNWPVVAFAIAMALCASILAGLAPAWSAARTNIEGALRASGRTLAGTGGVLKQTLVAGQVALAMLLLTGAGLLLRSAWLVQRVDPGFDASGVMTARLLLPESRYPGGSDVERAYTALHREMASRPEVGSAALVVAVPLSGATLNSSVFSDRQTPATDEPSNASLRLATPDYFRTMGIPLRAGRDLEHTDAEGAPPVVVINEALASLLWPGEPAVRVLGRRLSALSPKRTDPHWMTVVGVVGNVHDVALGRPAAPEFYAPVAQTPDMLWPLLQRSLVLVARVRDARTRPEALERPMATTVAVLDATLPLADARSMDSFLQGSTETARFNTLLLSTLGVLALGLAMTGVYGVVAWFVAQRRGEIGVRMAIGATPGAIWRFVMRRGFAPIGVGLLVGTALSLAMGGVLRDQLYGVTASDPWTLVAVIALLALVAAAAIGAPARRAMRISPMEALAG